jgi:hypothetical protein
MAVAINLTELPKCLKCKVGTLLPLEDVQTSSSAYLKGWLCNNPDCGWSCIQSKGTFIKSIIAEEGGER